MLLSALLLFLFFLILSAFFSSSETAFIASNSYKIDSLAEKGIKRAKIVQKLLKRVDELLVTILVGNTLVNTAAASIATFIFVSFFPDNKNQAVLLSTFVTTFLILIFSEITPKTYAAYNPIKLSLNFVQPIRFFITALYPVAKAFTFLSQKIFPYQKNFFKLSNYLDEGEIKVLLSTGVKGMSSLRKKMISGVLDIGSRPIREIMVPRPKIKAIEIGASQEQILNLVLNAGFSRFPVYRNRLDNIEGIIHAKDIIPYLVNNKSINLSHLIRKPFFVPESASFEKVLLQMQETANALVFVIDEFGNMEGIVTLEDIIEEIVGEIQDEYDTENEEWFAHPDENIFIVNGNAPIKDVNREILISLPEKPEYTTLAGFFLYQFGGIPRERDMIEYRGNRFIVEKMNKRQIRSVKIVLKQTKEEKLHESNCEK